MQGSISAPCSLTPSSSCTAPKTVSEMVVYQPDCLHVGVADRRSHEREVALLQRLAHLIRLLCPCRDLAQVPQSPRFSAVRREPPDVRIESSELLLDRKKGICILYRGGNLRSVADNPRVGQEGRHFSRIVSCDPPRIESVEGLSEVLTLSEDRQPGKTRLHAFENEEFEQLVVVVLGSSPFGVVVCKEKRVALRPIAPSNGISRRLVHVLHIDSAPGRNGSER